MCKMEYLSKYQSHTYVCIYTLMDIVVMELETNELSTVCPRLCWQVATRSKNYNLH